MRMCQLHWDKLKAAIDERGMSHLIAQGGEQAARNLTSEIQQGPSIQTFDPLMAAHNAIWANAMSSPVGMALMFNGPGGEERCPICFTRDEHAKAHAAGADHLTECTLTDAWFESWVELAADGSAQQYQRLLAAAEADA